MLLLLCQAGQQLAQQMQQSNPELVEQLRRQMGGEGAACLVTWCLDLAPQVVREVPRPRGTLPSDLWMPGIALLMVLRF